jgi:large subunit ribosomal protein L25
MSTQGYELNVESRNVFGKGNARRSRKAGLIPAVVYSKGQEAQAIFVKEGDWAALANHDFEVVTLVEGSKKTNAVVKEVQRNYLKDYVVHIDFHAIEA